MNLVEHMAGLGFAAEERDDDWRFVSKDGRGFIGIRKDEYASQDDAGRLALINERLGAFAICKRELEAHRCGT